MNAVQKTKLQRDLSQINKHLLECMADIKACSRELDMATEPSVRRASKATCIVADFFNMTGEQLVARDKSAPVVAARQVAQYILRRVLGWSLPEIALETGLTDHTTVMYSINKVEKMRAAHPEFDERIRKLMSLIIGDDECPRCEGPKHPGHCGSRPMEVVAQ